MMDQDRYDEAIRYFEIMAQSDSHYHVKLAWASAYAARAGIRIEKIYSFVVVKNLSLQNFSIKGLSLDRQTSALLSDWGRYLEQWKHVPSLNSEKIADVTVALEILRNIPEPGARLYSATLRVVALKSALDQGLRNWQITQRAHLCSEDLRPYHVWSLHLLENVLFVLEDLRQAFPDDRAKYEDFHHKISQIKNELENLAWPEENLCF